MPEEEEGIPPHSRVQGVLEYLTILGAAIAGMAHAPSWIAVPLASVVLLWVSDRGQHRWLVERVRRLAPRLHPVALDQRSAFIESRRNSGRVRVWCRGLVAMDGMSRRGLLSGSTEFDPIKFFLQPMKGVVADFTTGAHREEGAPSGPDGTRVQSIGRQARLFSW
jgi:hypothetical protein